IGLGDEDPSGRLELKALVAEAFDQVGDDPEGKAVQRVAVTSRSHVAGLGLDPLVGHLVQLGPVEEAVEVEVDPTSVRIVPAQCFESSQSLIVHTDASDRLKPWDLSPFVMSWALPQALGYYGDSVAVGVATFRRSRGCEGRFGLSVGPPFV